MATMNTAVTKDTVGRGATQRTLRENGATQRREDPKTTNISNVLEIPLVRLPGIVLHHVQYKMRSTNGT